MIRHSDILQITAAQGFNLCGVTRASHLQLNERFFEEWLRDGNASSLEYLHRNIDKRFDAARLVEGAQSVVVCAVSYRNAVSGGYAEGARCKVASYACTEDYHTTIKTMLRDAFDKLHTLYPHLSGRVFTDSAPLAEKQLAVEAGLGWIGRQSLLVTPEYGTSVLLGELVLADECDHYDVPIDGVGCGECNRCVEACPNGAVRERWIDTRRCISRATVEREDAATGTVPLHGWIFGCDECQNCCPYNAKARQHDCAAFDMRFDPRTLSAVDWQAMSEEEFNEKFARTPLSRSGLERIKRNV